MIKKLLLLLICLPFIGFGQNVNIPDANFKAYLVANTDINTNEDSEIQVSEAAVAENISLPYNPASFQVVSDLTGIEHFTSLTLLLLSSCSKSNPQPTCEEGGVEVKK